MTTGAHQIDVRKLVLRNKSLAQHGFQAGAHCRQELLPRQHALHKMSWTQGSLQSAREVFPCKSSSRGPYLRKTQMVLQRQKSPRTNFSSSEKATVVSTEVEPPQATAPEGLSNGALTSHAKGREAAEDDEAAFIAQDSLLKQLYFAAAAFLALAIARVADSLPAYMRDGRYDELITLISSLDPFLVGVIAFTTGRALLEMEERAKAGEESVDEMRQEALQKLTEFFERANMVVFGLALATFFRIGGEFLIEEGFDAYLILKQLDVFRLLP